MPCPSGLHASVRIPSSLVLVAQAHLLEVRVQLDLVDRRRHAGLRNQAFEVLRLEVGDPDRPHQPFRLQLDKGLPRLHIQVVGGHRPVDQVQIDVLQLEPLEARLARPLGLLVAVVVVPALGRDEDLLAIESRGVDRLADGALVAVSRGRVDVAVADASARATTSSVSRGGTWKTPNPSCGIDSFGRSERRGI